LPQAKDNIGNRALAPIKAGPQREDNWGNRDNVNRVARFPSDSNRLESEFDTNQTSFPMGAFEIVAKPKRRKPGQKSGQRNAQGKRRRQQLKKRYWQSSR